MNLFSFFLFMTLSISMPVSLAQLTTINEDVAHISINWEESSGDFFVEAKFSFLNNVTQTLSVSFLDKRRSNYKVIVTLTDGQHCRNPIVDTEKNFSGFEDYCFSKISINNNTPINANTKCSCCSKATSYCDSSSISPKILSCFCSGQVNGLPSEFSAW